MNFSSMAEPLLFTFDHSEMVPFAGLAVYSIFPPSMEVLPFGIGKGHRMLIPRAAGYIHGHPIE